jgi:hypothetical protein
LFPQWQRPRGLVGIDMRADEVDRKLAQLRLTGLAIPGITSGNGSGHASTSLNRPGKGQVLSGMLPICSAQENPQR